MAEKRRPGFNIPLNFYDGPEVDSIPKRIRAAAVGVWSLAGNYAATQLTDGYVPAGILKSFGCTDAIRGALKVTINKKGELSPLWIDARNGGIQLTNWPKHQRTNDEVTAYKASDAERKRLERESKRNATTTRNGETSDRTSDGQRTDVQSDSRDPKTETEWGVPESAGGGGVTVNARICAETALLHRSPSPRGERLRLERPAIHRQAHGSTVAGYGSASQVVRHDLVNSGGDERGSCEVVAERHPARLDHRPPIGEQVDLNLPVVVADANGRVLVGAGDVPRFHAEPDASVGNLNESSGIEDFFYVASGFGHAEMLPRVNTRVNTHEVLV